MKALSVKQPWASLIAGGHKTIETRTRRTNYRGDLLICSSQKPVSDAPFCLYWPPAGGKLVDPEDVGRWCDAGCKACLNSLPLGQALAVVSLVDCRPMTINDEDAAACEVYRGAFSWALDNIRPLEPFPVKGQLGIWEYLGERKTCRQLGHCTDSSIDCRDGDDKCPVWYPSAELFIEQIDRAMAGEMER